MKFNNISKALGTGLVAVGLSIGAAVTPAQAQVDLEDDVVVEDELLEEEGIYEDGYYESDFDWGWLGLLGLIGLAGLAGGRKRKETSTVYTEPVDPSVSTSTTDYRR